MAANQSVVLILLALLCLTAASSVSAGYVMDDLVSIAQAIGRPPSGSRFAGNGTTTSEVATVGRLYCSATVNFSPAAFGLPGVNVSCDGSSTDLAQAVTDTTGTYVFLLSLADGIAFDPSKCYVIVKLPTATCTVLPPTGTLRAPITLLNLVPLATGFVATLLAGTSELI